MNVAVVAGNPKPDSQDSRGRHPGGDPTRRRATPGRHRRGEARPGPARMGRSSRGGSRGQPPVRGRRGGGIADVQGQLHRHPQAVPRSDSHRQPGAGSWPSLSCWAGRGCTRWPRRSSCGPSWSSWAPPARRRACTCWTRTTSTRPGSIAGWPEARGFLPVTRRPVTCTWPWPWMEPGGIRLRGGSRRPGRRSCSRRGTGSIWPAWPSRASLDFLTIEDSLGPAGRPDGRGPGPPRRGADRRSGGARDHPDRAGAQRDGHPHRAVPRFEGHRHPGFRELRAGPGCGFRSPPAPTRPPTSAAGRFRPQPSRPTRRGDRRWPADLLDEAADYVEVLRRLWDSWEDDAEIRDVTSGRFIDRAKLHYIDFTGRVVLGQRAVDHAPVAAGPAPGDRAGPLQPAVPLRPGQRGCRLRHAARRRRRRPDRRRARRLARRAVGRPAGEVTILADLVVFLGPTTAAAQQRKSRLDEMFGQAFGSDAAVFVGTVHGPGRPDGGLGRRRAGRVPAPAGGDCRMTCG